MADIGSQPIELSFNEVPDAFGGKPKGPYIAQIKGPGERYALERGFIKWRNLVQHDQVFLPSKDGIWEVRDFPDAERRVRYYQTMGGAYAMLDTLSDQDVLDAVVSSDNKEWSELLSGDAQKEVADTLEVLVAIDEAETDLKSAINGEMGLDEEDIGMALDKIRQVVERL